jgi:AcrR family transcriptional regulator
VELSACAPRRAACGSILPVTSPEQPKPRRGRSAEKALATRASLLALADKLFAEQGYMQTSIRDIARRASVTSGAIYGHFRNKADLLVEVINMRTADELEASSRALADEDYVATLTRMGRDVRKRRQLRALIVQGAAAAVTDDDTRDRLRDEQLSHINAWVAGYRQHREKMGIHSSVEVHDALLYTWAAEVGLGVLEAVGIQPKSAKGWADAQNRLARGLQLPPDAGNR